MEPLLSLNQARAILGSLKGVKRISYPAIVRLVKKEGLPIVPNPFNPGAWAFKKSLIDSWFQAYISEKPTSVPLRSAGRPRLVSKDKTPVAAGVSALAG